MGSLSTAKRVAKAMTLTFSTTTRCHLVLMFFSFYYIRLKCCKDVRIQFVLLRGDVDYLFIVWLLYAIYISVL